MENKAKLLIADDNADTVELLTKRFRSEGYETAAAYDGEQALRMVQEFVPELIILDIMMPKIDGLEVCRQLKENDTTKHIPVLMLTAKSDVSDKVRGLDTGADGYLTKPFDYPELAARVRSLLARKDASLELAQKEKLAALNHMVDEVSHEVRNPLVTIGGFTRRMLKNSAEDDPNRKYLEIILKNVASLEKMVEQLVALKSAVASRTIPSDINGVVSLALERKEGQIRGQKIMVDTRFMENPPLVPADHENLTTAIANIIENSIEAMENSPLKQLSITTGTDRDYFEIKIIDSGRGIAPDAMKNIYDPFYTSKTYGPGLGLTFALKTIRSHEGTISVQSEIGKGTCFIIRIPLEVSSPQV